MLEGILSVRACVPTFSQNTHGRMKVIGVKPAAPMRPIKSAKNGRQIATNAVTTTYRLRTTARINLGCLDGQSCCSVTEDSIFSNTGWANTCITVTCVCKGAQCKDTLNIWIKR